MKLLLRVGIGIVGLLVIAILSVVAVLYFRNDEITVAIQGDAFRQELDKQTSKGLHFKGAYESFQRTGLLSVASPSFEAADGVKAMKSLKATDIRGTFNPWGVLLRRWQIDNIRIKSGVVELQTYEPKPPEVKPKPWYAIFMPDRVYLTEVICEKTDAFWKMQDEKAGFYGIQLRITPYGRDFEYHATGGVLRMKPLPEMELCSLEMRITRPELTLYHLDLGIRDTEATLRIEGRAGMRDDKSVNATAKFEKMPIAPWLPDSWREGTRGIATGEIHWIGSDQKLEASSGSGFINLTGVKLNDLAFLDYIASAAQDESLKVIEFDECSLKFFWKYPEVTIEEVTIAAKNVFRVNGALTVEGGALRGTLQLGVNPRYLEWIPKAKEEIFTREDGGFVWTPVQVSGTLREPETDLLPRFEKVLKESPGNTIGLFFRQAGEWFEQKLKRDIAPAKAEPKGH